MNVTGCVNQGYFLSVDVLERTEFQGPFDVDQMSPRMFWMEPNVLKGFKLLTMEIS